MSCTAGDKLTVRELIISNYSVVLDHKSRTMEKFEAKESDGSRMEKIQSERDQLEDVI